MESKDFASPQNRHLHRISFHCIHMKKGIQSETNSYPQIKKGFKGFAALRKQVTSLKNTKKWKKYKMHPEEKQEEETQLTLKPPTRGKNLSTLRTKRQDS